mmetsp:Transcript_29840/g.36818  ORF Transcript_29840/g.36818 Transcript_29840/m.36818 type:complete len:80 (-) Transcript_29840:84-323(-)
MEVNISGTKSESPIQSKTRAPSVSDVGLSASGRAMRERFFFISLIGLVGMFHTYNSLTTWEYVPGINAVTESGSVAPPR